MLLSLAMFCDASYARTLQEDAILDYQFQDYDQAKKKFETILNSTPGNITAHYYMGIILQLEGKYDAAIRHLEIASKASPPAEGIEEMLANTYLAAGKAQKALPYFKKRYQANPQDEHIAFQYAKALEGVGEFDHAARIYRAIIRNKGQMANTARYRLGQILSNLGAYASAVELMRAINPTSPYSGVAKSYLDALVPVTRPVSTFASAEYFYNDNPGTHTSALTGIQSVTPGSQGITLTAALNSRAFDMTDHLQAKVSYLYYGTFYKDDLAKDNDFVGHFINPSLTYRINNNMDIELKSDTQFFYFGHQRLSTNIGGTVTGTYHLSTGNLVNLHTAYLRKQFTDHSRSSGTITSLKYLDANSWSVGGGSTLTAPAWGGTLVMDYTFNNEQTRNTSVGDLQLAQKSRDSRFREHAIRVDATLPFIGFLSRAAVLGNMRYSYKDFPNLQTGVLYSDVAGQHIKAASLTLGVQLQVTVWDKAGLNLSAGYERTTSHSQTATLTYRTNRYFGQLSAGF